MKKRHLSTLGLLIVATLLTNWQITCALAADSSSNAYVKVAVLNAPGMPPYAQGGAQNNFAEAIDILDKDPYILPEAVTDAQIQGGILDPGAGRDFDVLLLPDNWPEIASNPKILDFWSNNEGGIVALDSAIEFLCYVGILPEESAGDNGYGVYWDYGTIITAQISTAHPVTAGYTVGENITGVSGDARYNVTALAGTTSYPYYTMLANEYSNTTWAYVSAYAPPDKGRVVHNWNQRPENLPTRLMLLNSVKWAANAPSLAELLGLDALQDRVSALETQLTALQNQLSTLGTQVTDLQNQTTSLQNQLTNLQNQLTSLQDQLTTVEDTLASDVADLEAQINSLENSLNEMNSTLTTQTENVQANANSAQIIGYAGIGIGIIGIIIATVAIISSRKKPIP